MGKIAETIKNLYGKAVLDHPVLVILFLSLLIGGLGYQARYFKIDASAETLLLENDQDLRYTRQVNNRYGVNDLLLVSFTPKSGDLLAQENLETLRRLRDELAALDQVDSVFSILDAYLLESPPISYSDFSGSLPTLETPGVNIKLARKELSESFFYRDLIVAPDLKTTALILNLKVDAPYHDLVKTRNTLLDKKADRTMTRSDRDDLDSLNRQIRQRLDELNVTQHKNIRAVRDIIAGYQGYGTLYLGGISMIADDMMSFIKNDLKIFGVGVFLLLIVMLGAIFQRKRWIFLPMLCCFLSVIAMMGILGTFDWEVTVISSNFISLQLIITLAVSVHLIVRYREFHEKNPDMDQRTLVQKTVYNKFIPCLYATLTTIAGFGSLLLCDIRPVIHFGWMMSAGVFLSLILTFVLFPAALVLMKKPKTSTWLFQVRFSVTDFLADFTQKHGGLILALTLVATILTVAGASRLLVENSFIDYFKQDTEIYQGMKLIDQKLGGTTPLDVVVQFDAIDMGGPEDDLFFDDPFAEETQTDNDAYWFTEDRMRKIEEVHDYLEGLPEIGKVLSFGTLLKIGRNLNHDKSLDSLDASVLYSKLPAEYKDMIISPYLSIKDNEARFYVRIKDSLKSLKRDALLKKISRDLTGKLEIAPEKAHLAGSMLLYNNMLQSLFSSQIKTLGVVALALSIMFLVLFRSIKLALIALFPNLLSAGSVLGVMGWLDIPLDMMTITIAAISIGIAVDDTIHYIYRFREEITKNGDYYRTLHRCHSTIGHAMYYTSITIVIGFSILVFSNFWPTIYFGVFTGLAMVIALLAALTLLPQLIVVIKPFGPDRGKLSE